MQIQHNPQLNQQKFTGRVAIVNELSEIPTRQVRKSADALKAIFKEKNFDLFIEQDYKSNKLLFTAQKPEHFGQADKPRVSNLVSINELPEDSDLYEAVGKHVAIEYEKLPQPKTFGQKLKAAYEWVKIGIQNL